VIPHNAIEMRSFTLMKTSSKSAAFERSYTITDAWELSRQKYSLQVAPFGGRLGLNAYIGLSRGSMAYAHVIAWSSGAAARRSSFGDGFGFGDAGSIFSTFSALDTASFFDVFVVGTSPTKTACRKGSSES
jgi:hypothetical protein